MKTFAPMLKTKSFIIAALICNSILSYCQTSRQESMAQLEGRSAESKSLQPQVQITADEIVNKYIEKRGGMKNILSIRTLIYRNAGFTMVRARPYYFLVGDPKEMARAEYAEGNDGAHWEFFRDLGLVLRTTGPPANAIRHTAYFDDELVASARELGFTVKLEGKEMIEKNDAYKLHITYPDGFESYVFIDSETWLMVARRFTAPVHAFGKSVASETRFFNWKTVNGVLYPFNLHEVEIATNKTLNKGGWKKIEANIELPRDIFSPPSYQKSAINRMLNSVYAAREIPENALGWYRDFHDNPENDGIDTSEGMGAIGYQILKTGSFETATLVLEENVKDFPNSVLAQFGLGRAYLSTGRRREAIDSFRSALKIDPNYKRAAEWMEDAINSQK